MEFTIVKAKLPLFLKCQKELPPNSYQPYKQSYRVQMNWERLILFGSDAQIRHFDRLRQIYIQKLLKKHTRRFYKCTIDYIGSHSPKSDIDIELYCSSHLELVHHSILQDHSSKYPHISLNELYDINLYSTIYHYLNPQCTTTKKLLLSCYPKQTSNKRQRQWSFVRIVESLMELSPSSRKRILDSFPSSLQSLYKDTTTLLVDIRKKYKNHTQMDYMLYYIGLLKHRTEPPETIAEAFSMASWGEIETYRSIGAILHIVEEIPKLQPSLYYDSIYDNLGFIYDIMCRKTLCFKEQTIYHFVRSTKYMGRILNAMASIHSNINIQCLQSMANAINQKRKAMIPMDQLTSNVEELLNELNVKNFSQIDFLIQFTHFIQSHLPKDPFYS